jgi:ABC-2 type transport system permease protein
MSTLVLALRQVQYENIAFRRNPAAAFFTLVFPLMFLVIFNLMFGNNPMDVPGGTTTTSTFFVPAIAAFSVINACYTNMAMSVSIARDQGLLKRIRGTPLPAWGFMFGRIAHVVLVSFALVAIVTAAGALFYDVDMPTNTFPAFLITLAIGAAAFCSLALAVTALIPNADASPAIVNASILPLLFISGVFIPMEDAPAWLNTFADVFPVRHFSSALLTAFNPFETGAGFEPVRLAVLAGWGAVGLVVALRFFSWEPRR